MEASEIQGCITTPVLRNFPCKLRPVDLVRPTSESAFPQRTTVDAHSNRRIQWLYRIGQSVGAEYGPANADVIRGDPFGRLALAWHRWNMQQVSVSRRTGATKALQLNAMHRADRYARKVVDPVPIHRSITSP